jgi:hypothetical protein
MTRYKITIEIESGLTKSAIESMYDEEHIESLAVEAIHE